jgi:RNAse (barnase) inhibitor barstar
MNLDQIVVGSAGGVLRCSRESAAELAGAAQAAGLEFVTVDTRKARDKPAFLRASAEALHFPEYFGHNWDAFYDCVAELAAQSGRGKLIVFEDLSGFARTEPEEFATAVDALRDAVEFWAEQSKRLIVLIELDQPLLAPELSGLTGSSTGSGRGRPK